VVGEEELIGLTRGVAIAGIMSCEFEKHIWKKTLEIVKKRVIFDLQYIQLNIIMRDFIEY
jgi:hypothetical protein